MNVVSIKGLAPGADAPRFCGSGLLVGPSHVLTAQHVWQEVLRMGGTRAWIELLPDCAEALEAEHAGQHPAGLDACLLRVKAWEAPSDIAFPRLMKEYRPLTQHAVVLRALTPTMPRVVPVPLTVTAFDHVASEYEVASSVASGHSGGAVLQGGLVVGLMTRRVQNQPLARFLSMHALASWVRDTVGGGGEGDDGQRPAPRPARTPGTSPPGIEGLSHRMGSIHLHVDGAQARTFVEDLVDRHGDAGYDAELAWVVRAVPGPQRDEMVMRGVYELHDPGALDFFSTTQLHAGPGLPTQPQRRALSLAVHDILCELHEKGAGVSGTVVELERVVGTVDARGQVEMAEELKMRGTGASLETLPALQLFAPFNTREPRSAGLASYELHFSIDIDKTPETAEQAPVALEDLHQLAVDAGIEFGGWFLFNDARRWAYRSNAFVPTVTEGALKRRWQLMRRGLDASPIRALAGSRLRLVAEEALAVWHAPLMLRRDGLMPVHALIAWETGLEGLREFWVLLPNFLGDQSEAMRMAMETNLNRGAHYTYFLSSHADAKRWLNFRDELAQHVPGAASRMTAYVVAFAPNGPLSGVAAFIANPRSEEPEGYELTVDAASNRVLYGTEMEAPRMAEVVSALSSASGNAALTDWHLVQPTGPDVTLTSVCVKLIDEPAPDALDALIDRLDNRLARLASQHGGSVELYGGRSITVVFVGNRTELGRALVFVRKVLAESLSADAGLQCPVRIGLAYGNGRLTARASGRIWNGPAVRESHRVLDCAPLRPGIFVRQSDADPKPPFEAGSVVLVPAAPGALEVTEPPALPAAVAEPAL